MPGSKRLMLLVQIALLAACSWFIWTNVVAPRRQQEGLAPILAEAFVYVLAAWAVSAFAVLWAYTLISTPQAGQAGEEAGEITRLSLWSSAPAMWLAPALILMSALEPAPMLLGLILLINVTALLVGRWTRLSGVAFSGPLFRSSLPSLGGALAIQTGALFLWLDYRFLAAALFFTASVALTVHAIVSGAYQPRKDPLLPPSALSPVVAFLLALLLTATGIGVSAGWPGPGGVLQSARTILRNLWHPTPEAAAPEQSVARLYVPPDPHPEEPTQDPNFPDNGGFPGVVLRPQRKDRKQPLILPRRPEPGQQTAALTRPLHIPFTGEYWLYQERFAPLFNPPPSSVVRYGSPLELSFHTADRRAMRMEAHQRFDPPLRLDCCSSIQLIVSRGSDPWPINVALNAIDSTKLLLAPGKVSQLGASPLGYGSSASVSFQVPSNLRERRCDVLEAVFTLQAAPDIWAWAQSLHVEVEEIVLTP